MFSVFRDLVRYNIEFAIGVVLVSGIVVFALLSFISPYDPTQSIPRSRPAARTAVLVRHHPRARTCSGN
jgi:peptide/nickel transport system permease protein